MTDFCKFMTYAFEKMPSDARQAWIESLGDLVELFKKVMEPENVETFLRIANGEASVKEQMEFGALSMPLISSWSKLSDKMETKEFKEYTETYIRDEELHRLWSNVIASWEVDIQNFKNI